MRVARAGEQAQCHSRSRAQEQDRADDSTDDPRRPVYILPNHQFEIGWDRDQHHRDIVIPPREFAISISALEASFKVGRERITSESHRSRAGLSARHCMSKMSLGKSCSPDCSPCWSPSSLNNFKRKSGSGGAGEPR